MHGHVLCLFECFFFFFPLSTAASAINVGVWLFTLHSPAGSMMIGETVVKPPLMVVGGKREPLIRLELLVNVI
jgi:hypothetical protein